VDARLDVEPFSWAGCIAERLEKPKDIAFYSLSDEMGWKQLKFRQLPL
jgi:hypothetical protein